MEAVLSVSLSESLSLALERVSRTLELRVAAVVNSGEPKGVGGGGHLNTHPPPSATSPPSVASSPVVSGSSAVRMGGGGGLGLALGALAPQCALGLELHAYARQFAQLLGTSPSPTIPSTPAAVAAVTPSSTAAVAAAVAVGEHRPALLGALERCAALSDSALDRSLAALLLRLRDAPPPCPPDLSCPPALLEIVSGLLELLAAAERAHAEPHARARAIADAVLGAIERACEEMADDRTRALSALSDAERTVLRLNCIAALASALDTKRGLLATDAVSSCAAHVVRLRVDAARLCDSLVDEQTTALFHKCGLSAKLAALQTAREQPGVQLAAIPSLEPAAMAALMRGFYALLYGTSSGASGSSLMPECERVAEEGLRQLVVRRVSSNVSLAHRSLFEAISEPHNGYAQAEPHVVLHTPAQVDTLLDCIDE
mmetsp:Transcript_17059/g.39383  ORF Transcript_17059/g.39383 Transcript_17059/m.39383 type:complete len:430 (+) Transcript_17059:133-1422(+)